MDCEEVAADLGETSGDHSDVEVVGYSPGKGYISDSDDISHSESEDIDMGSFVGSDSMEGDAPSIEVPTVGIVESKI